MDRLIRLHRLYLGQDARDRYWTKMYKDCLRLMLNDDDEGYANCAFALLIKAPRNTFRTNALSL